MLNGTGAKKLDVTEDEYREAFRLASKHTWLQRDDDFALALHALLLECRQANCPWLAKALLEHFKVLTSADLNEVTKLIAEQIENEYLPATTLVTAVSTDSKPDGSEIIINSLKSKLSSKWKNSLSNAFANALKKDKENILTYILVDDFIGTGAKISELLKSLTDHLNRYNVSKYKLVVATFASMESGEKFIKSIFPEVSILSGYVLKKGISEQLQEPIRSRARDAMIEIESTIIPNFSKWTPGVIPENPSSYNFGYNQSEALVWIEGFNIPNNVFPLFWYQPKQRRNEQNYVARRTLFNRR